MTTGNLLFEQVDDGLEKVVDTGRPGLEYEMRCQTAERFLDALAPKHDEWEQDPIGWVYRGQANAAWKLQALGIRRPTKWAEYGIRGDATKWPERKVMNEQLLERFRRGLDDAGVVIPSPSPVVRNIERNRMHGGDDPDPEAFPLMALAQHHGLPTMLLDWSRQSAVGAYFAASFAADPATEDLGSHLAVWALRTREHFPPDWAMGWRKSGHLRLYTAPGGTNPNLRAQSGVFTILWGETNPDLEKYLAFERSEQREAPRLRLFTLPITEAAQLLRLLAFQGVTAATMFPGIDAVVRAMREETRWAGVQTP